MQDSTAFVRSPAGFKHFFTPRPLDSKDLSIRGLGVRELMPSARIRRAQGTGDYLLMQFHEAAFMSTQPGQEELQKPETLIIWPPGVAQYYGHPFQHFSHTWIHCEGRAFVRILRGCRLPLCRPLFLPQATVFPDALLRIHGELASYSQPDPVITLNLLENCLRDMARQQDVSRTKTSIPENLLAVRRWIGTAPARRTSLSEMARMAGLSVPHFSARFKKIFNISPVECLIQHRLHHAAYLLADKNLSIGEIASQVGYEDVFHFSKAFKKHFGRSPRAMRTPSTAKR